MKDHEMTVRRVHETAADRGTTLATAEAPADTKPAPAATYRYTYTVCRESNKGKGMALNRKAIIKLRSTTYHVGSPKHIH